jgi:hypothetical protein
MRNVAKFLYSYTFYNNACLYIYKYILWLLFTFYHVVHATAQIIFFSIAPLFLLTYALLPAESLVCLRKTELCSLFQYIVSFSSCWFLSSSLLCLVHPIRNIYYCSPTLRILHNKIYSQLSMIAYQLRIPDKKLANRLNTQTPTTPNSLIRFAFFTF